METKKEQSESKHRWCINCFQMVVPKHRTKVREYLINGFWLSEGVPSEKMLCPNCVSWVDSRLAYDIH